MGVRGEVGMKVKKRWLVLVSYGREASEYVGLLGQHPIVAIRRSPPPTQVSLLCDLEPVKAHYLLFHYLPSQDVESQDKVSRFMLAR